MKIPIKERWKYAEIIGSYIDLNKFQVYNHGLINDLIEHGWLEAAVNGDLDILTQVKFLPGYLLAKKIEANTITIDMQKHNNKETIINGVKKKKIVHIDRTIESEGEEVINDPIAIIKVAMWFINKIENADKAKKAIDAASIAMELINEHHS